MKTYLRHMLFTLCLTLAPVWSQSMKESAEKEISAFFKGGVILAFDKVSVSPDMRRDALLFADQNYSLPYLYYWRVIKNDSLIAHAFVDNVFGKQMPITFLVIFDTHNRVIKNSILQYREIKGRAVKNQDWLDSFIGKDMSSDFRYGTAIDALSGSTISAKSMTLGVKKLSQLVTKMDKITDNNR